MTEHSHHEHDHEHEHDHLEGHEGHEHITIVDEEGNEILHEVLFTFESEDYNKSYVLCYPAGIPEGEEGTEGQLNPIETEAEWDMIEEVLNTFLAEEDL